MTAKRILLVDDEPNVVKSCARMLELEGFAVEGITSGAEAIDLYQREHFDLVLTDLKMPDVDGLDVLTAVREHNPSATVVIFTAYGTKESVVKALRLGAREFLEKPLDTKSLAATVRTILKQETGATVRGNLHTMSLASIFQVNCTELNQARLRIRHGGQEGNIYFADGEVVHADLGSKIGEEAIYELLGWEDGEFELEMNIPASERTITTGWSGLLLEGKRRLDEQSAGLDALDDLEEVGVASRENLTQALAQANQRLQQQVQNWTTLNDIARAISSTLEEPEIFRRVVQNVTRILRMEACSLLLVDQETGELEFAVTLKGDVARYSAFRLKPGQGIAGWVAKHGEPLHVPDVTRDPRFYAHVDRSTGFESRSILCVPLKTKGRVIGVLEAINKQGQAGDTRFTEEDLEMLTALASWVTVAVENARLNRATREMAAVAALKQTVTAMAHHVNNRLMAFSLELDGLETAGTVDQTAVSAIIASARRSILEVSAVVKALDRLEEIHTTPYAGTAEMIDIEDALREQLSGADVQPEYTRRP